MRKPNIVVPTTSASLALTMIANGSTTAIGTGVTGEDAGRKAEGDP